MRRRSLIQSFIACIPFRSARLWAQGITFPADHDKTLKDLAAIVLPESLGRSGTDAVAEQFVRWVRDYRAGAEMQSGYGVTRIRYRPDSPVSRYLEQLAHLASGALAQTDLSVRRAQLAQAMQAAKIDTLPQLPTGEYIVSDLMAFYFQSSEANDLAYSALIGKDKCRTLRNSSSAPQALKKGANYGEL